jgi:hypothetical protein
MKLAAFRVQTIAEYSFGAQMAGAADGGWFGCGGSRP